MARRYVPLIVLVVALTVTVLGSISFLGNRSDEESNRGQHSEAVIAGFERRDDLVYHSDLIVEAEFVSEVEEDIWLESPLVPGEGTFTRTDVTRTFRINHVIKGELAQAQIEVTYTLRLQDGARLVYEMVLPPFETGTPYVLFLRSYGTDAAQWGPVGEPGGARLQGHALKFFAVDEYQRAMEAQNTPILPDSGAPFRLTMAELRDLVDRNEPPPTPFPPVGTGTPAVTPTPRR